jgi:hypothetical protein
MMDVRISEVDAKLASVNMGAWRVNFGNHRNHTILV